jgi:hypothetical protein
LEPQSRNTDKEQWEANQVRQEGETRFAFKLRLKREWEVHLENQKTIFADQWKEFIPDLGPEPPAAAISPQQQALDEFIKLISITDAYNRWAGKGFVQAGNRKDSIKVRCPNPAHPDNNPSAWINTEKNVFKCGSCDIGGDIWYIAAWRFGYPVPGFKNDPATFRALREKIGEDFGVYVEKGIAGDYHIVQTTPQVTPPTAPPTHDQQAVTVNETPETNPLIPTADKNLAYLPSGSEDEERTRDEQIAAARKYPSIAWRDIVPSETFLRAYLEATTVDDVPEEFHFWNGLLGLGMAVGGMRTLEDAPPVSANLFVCFVGGTGTGKSKGKRHLAVLLHQALPYQPDDQPPFGSQYLNGIQSGEVLIKQFQHPMIEPATGKPIGHWPGVRVLADFEELATLVGKNNRQGSTLKNVLMDMYDAPLWLSSTSITHGNIVAHKPFGSAVTTTQYDSIRNLITRSDDSSGFANRWTFATGVPKRQFSVNRTRVDLTRAAGMLSGINIRCRAEEQVLWTEDGEKAWDAFFHGPLHTARVVKDMSIIQRLDLMLKKLFLLFAINENSVTVTESIVNRVISLFPHLLETYSVVEEKISATEEGDDTERMLRHIKRLTSSTRGPTPTELYRVMKSKNNSMTKIRKLLENLVVLGMVTELKVPPGPAGGRPTSCYVLAPGVEVAV